MFADFGPPSSRGAVSWLPVIALVVVVTSLLFVAGQNAKHTEPAVAQPAAAISTLDLNAVTNILPVAALYEDVSGVLSATDVIKRNEFTPWQQQSANFGFSKSAWWVRVTITNNESKTRQLAFRQDYPLIDHLAVWQLAKLKPLKVTETGDFTPFESRIVKHRDFIIPIELAAGESKTYLFRYQTQGSLNIGLWLAPMVPLMETIAIEQLAYGLYYGGFAVLVIYNLLLFLTIVDRALFYYLAYVVSYGLYMATHNGLTFQFLWPQSPALANQSLLVLLALTLVFALKFSRHILQMRSLSIWLDRASEWLATACSLALIGCIVLPYDMMVLIQATLTTVVTGLILVMGSWALFKRHPIAGYFMLAWGALLIGVLIYMAKSFGYLPHNSLTQNAFQIGALVEMVLLSLALGSRINTLKLKSEIDPLTNLLNRRQFDERIGDEFRRAKQRKQALSLVMLDIDWFKKVNDQFGHSAGDDVLRELGRQLLYHIRQPAMVCRFGGEEFAIIVPRTKEHEAVAMTRRLLTRIRCYCPAQQPITLSAGVACMSAEMSQVDDLIKAADSALYQAKQLGRDKICCYQDMALL
ncbi:GGDEF domain-containing protein [Neiella sp. HB171785]|uniref:diguanylate cyclase n=1 Tax=Neiella litorisoli TaxID=2771431 RepID=A0A8J6QSS2_9GAMM|nr:diguanylate cyclase [Neiella litorisoli]MBD1390154.1 GGDEF domain-containing protein [Neiella litorisoli]